MHFNSKIYIAGHSGLVGSAIMRNLQARGYVNLLTRAHVELDLTRQQAVEDFFIQEKPEYVFLAAAKVGGIYANTTFPAEFIRDNLALQNNIINASYISGVRRLLFLGSSCIYPKFSPQPMKEEYLLTGPLEPTNRPYALAKIAGIEMCWSYNRQFGTEYLAVMPTNLYGPGDSYNLMNSHVIPAMIRKFYLAKLASEFNWSAIEQDEVKNGPIPQDMRDRLLATCNSRLPPIVSIWGTGTPRREFMYSEDMADACVYLMNLLEDQFKPLLSADRNEGLPPMINVGVGLDLTIRELAETIKEIVGYQGKIEFDTNKPDGTSRKLVDVQRLSAIGWKASTDIQNGLVYTYQDFKSGNEC